MTKKINLASLMLVLSLAVYAQTIPSTYYSSIDGEKKENLKLELGKILANHTKRTYDQLKTDYKSVYVVSGTKEQVYDLYCDKVYDYSDGGWNREHTVANSYWGGTKIEAYSDLFSVIPSETTSNSRKSNYPPSELSSVKYDTGRIKIGKAVSGQGNGYAYSWEPYDEYKGDFARIIMYVATCYYNISWNSQCPFTKEAWPTMDSWLYKLMLKWHNQDPVCEKEIEINEAVYGIQHNRNPFVDYPILADYIWGDLTTVTFDLDKAVPHQHYNGETPSTAFSVTPTEIDMGDVIIGEEQEVSFTVTPLKLTNDITISTSIGQLSDTKVSKSATQPVEVFLTYTPDEEGEFSGKVTVSDSKTIKVITISGKAYRQEPPVEIKNDLFVEVRHEPTDWNGEYLIVYKNNQTEGLILDGSLTTFDGANKSVKTSLINDAVYSTDDKDYLLHSFTFETYQDGYSIRSASGLYLGNDGKSLSQSEYEKTEYSITLSGGIERQEYILKYNTGANMFRFYKTGQQTVNFFRAMQLGDVNNDGKVDKDDIPALESFIQSEESSSYVMAAADMNADGEIDYIDKALLEKKIGKPTSVTGISSSVSTIETVRYNLSGQQVDSSYKGIVISRGKKYLVR